MSGRNEITYIRSASHSVNLAEGLFSAKAASSPAPPKDPFPIVTTQDAWNRFLAQPVLLWGSTNKFPYELDAAAKKVGILQQGLNRLVSYAYNQGIFHYEVLEEDPGTGIEKIKILHDPAVDAFIQYSRIHDYLQRSFRNYFKYGINYPVYMLNDARKVAQLRCYESREVRLEKPHPESGLINHIYVSAKWAEGMMNPNNSPFFIKIALLDEFNLQDELEYTKEFMYAQRIRGFMYSGDDYGGAEWHSVYFNKWLNISASVPELKERLFMYAMTINYMIYIDDAYWESVYGKETWEGWDADTRTEKVKDLQAAIERDLMGKDNAFKTLFASMMYVEGAKPNKSIIIEAIDNKLREGTFIPDNLHANGEILAALGVDACLLGATVLGDKISAGSGSNIREAALNLISTLRPVRDLQLEPLYVCKERNGWDKKIKFGFKDYIIGTQDGRPPVNGNENKPV